MRVRVKHESVYRYDEPAAFGPHTVRLRPAAHARANILTYNLDVSPKPSLHWVRDPWNNLIARLTFPPETRARELRIAVDLALDIQPVNPFDFDVDERSEFLPAVYPDGLSDELAPFLDAAPGGPLLQRLLAEVPAEGRVIDYLVALNRHVAKRVRYIIRHEPGVQASEETLGLGSGSCRDSARLLVEALRAQGFAARFVSGYLVQLTDEGIIPEEAKGVSRDVVDLHAWCEAFVPGAGWIGLDGTSGLLCGEGHIPLAVAVAPEHAAPLDGTTSVGATGFSCPMSVHRLGHEPRPRVPYTDETWSEIEHAGDTVDRLLLETGVVLTSGGEPTWTSRLHPAEPEWLVEALGPTKWTQGLALAAELSKRLATGVLLMRQQGKHYPGESLPRWALRLLWRRDGVAVWKDPGRLAFEARGPERSPAAEALVAERFVLGLARRLGVEPHLCAGFEDPWHFIQGEANLPDDLDPLAFELDDGEERARLSRVMTRGLRSVVGYALPLALVEERWRSGRWTFRRGHLFLLPGDGPMGFRLPLDRIGGTPLETPVADVTAVDRPLPADPRTGLPQRELSQAERRAGGAAAPGVLHAAAPAALGAPAGPPRTALCVEAREGVLHVFLPPVPTAEAFLELVACVEDTARELDVRVRLEGYGPPSDPRLASCLVTPDPGVLEVNLPVAESFREYAASLELVNDAANHAGLSTEKWQLDGRATGSGGGNHLTLGGKTTVESPFLRQPELLASLLRYLQNHPSLSYLFSGLFLGPTSQAPRVDEARFDGLYELELSLAQVPRPDDPGPVFPWTIDRLLRNLLIDVAGNTHRTELCIDKLYSPDSLSGRQGIVELRAFEMPPHERMAAVQMLLVRTLIARFAREPYRNPLVRWGSLLHDRFMLPYYLWRDLEDIARDVRRVGLPFDAEWFRPFLDHRFPIAGTLRLEDMEVELRLAAEPWPTLGEQAAGPAVARYVDSSLERVQVRVSGLTEGRHLVTVNGRHLPLRPTGTATEAVAGVRFRAWQPPNCLQPNLPIDHPLHFDVIDLWGKRSLGRCTFHVWHPDGHAFDEVPLTAFEAAARRAQRFTVYGASPWPAEVRATTPSPEQPYTLDLRRHAVARPVEAT